MYSENFDAGPPLGPQWNTYTSNAGGQIMVTGTYGTASGPYALVMDSGSSTGAYYNLNEAIWTVNLSSVNAPSLNFFHRDWSDDINNFSTDFSGHFNADGVAISSDAVTWHPIWNAPTSATWQQYTIDLAAQAATHGITLGADVKIKFQQYDNYTITTDGHAYDQIAITSPMTAEDWYKFTIDANESTTLALGASASGVKLELYDSSGALLATGHEANNVTQVINNFVATVAGVYYVRVSGNGADYRLVATKNADFDTELNDTQAAAQVLSGTDTALGYLGGTGGGTGIKMGLIQDSLPWSKTSNTVVAGQLGYTVTLIPSSSLATVDLSAYKLIVLAGDQSSTAYAAVQSNISRIEAYVAAGGVWVVNYAASSASLPYTYDVLPDAAGLSFIATSGTDINVLAPTSGLISGPGGIITNTTLDGGTSSDHGYTTGAIPAGGTSILSTGTASQVVALDYGYGLGHVLVHTIPVEYYNALGNFGQIFHKNLFNFAGSFTPGTYIDCYKISVNAGDPLTISTTTPGDGPDQFVNTLDPKIELYDPSGNLVASDDNSVPDGRNAKLAHNATMTGNYVVRVLSAGAGSGEYILNVNTLRLMVAVPVDVTEGMGTATGTVSLPEPVASDLVINLSSGNPARITVPSSVIIPAGQTSTPLPITILDDLLMQGPEQVTISASASGYNIGVGSITLHDNETANLTVSLPATATEGDGVLSGQGIITVSQAPSNDVLVSLISSDNTEITVPATVKILASQTSAIFDVTIVDDAIIDGTQTAAVTGHVENWTDGSASMDVQDNDRTLSIILPADAWEGQGTKIGAGNVRIGGSIGTNLVVSLVSNDTSELLVPATVTIPAGQTSATFNLTIADDSEHDGANGHSDGRRR